MWVQYEGIRNEFTVLVGYLIKYDFTRIKLYKKESSHKRKILNDGRLSLSIEFPFLNSHYKTCDTDHLN